MKRTLAFLLSALFCLTTVAAEVTPRKAMQVAEAFFGATKAINLHFIELPSTKSGAAQNFYIIGRDGGGFVIIPSSDKTMPVLAYSLENSFFPDALSPALKWWLDNAAKAVKEEEQNSTVNEDIQREWQNVTKAGEAVLHELKTPQWGQSSPFNDFCPLVGEERCEAGCVATALAEIMSFYGYPEKGSGILPSYYDPVRRVTQEGHALGAVYDWARLKELSDYAKVQAADTELKENLSQLFWDLGIMTQMQYNPGSSGTYPSIIIEKMGEFMGYNKEARMEHKDLYDFDIWCAMLRSQIDKSQPILYDGQDLTQGGHAFVIDGYSEQDTDLFCINWGWDGKNNGVYRLWSNFPNGQSAIFELTPDPESKSRTPDGDIFLQSYDKDKEPACGIMLTRGTIAKGQSFSLTIGQIANSGTAPYKAKLRFDLVDRNGKVKQEGINNITVEIDSEPPYSYRTENIPCTLNVEPAFGDKIVTMHRSAAGGGWKRLKGFGDGSTVAELPVFPQLFIELKQTYAPMEKVELKLVNYDAPWIYNANFQQRHTVWTIYGADGKQLAQIDNSVNQWTTTLFFEKAGYYLLVARIYDKSGTLTDTVCAPITIK